MTQQKVFNKKSIAGAGVGIWILAMVVLHYVPSPNATFMDGQFRFNVYCPISYDKENRLVDFLARSAEAGDQIQYNTGEKGFRSINDLKKLKATNNPVLNTTFVVYIKVRYNSNDPRILEPDTPFPYISPKWQLSYCSLAARAGQQCSDVDHTNYVCMSPGPAFAIKSGVETDVIWVNDITPEESHLMPHSIQDGYHQNKTDPYYRNEGKSAYQLDSSCTYHNSEQAMGPSSPKYQLSWDTVPISTHVHGLEVRPAFDGNPLSWFTADGGKGVGYLSLGLNDDYFNQEFFRADQRNIAINTKVTFEKGVKNIKHNRYPNDQLPGNLWYHDHGMRGTYFNVRNGLAGAYIIYNETIEGYLNSIADTEYLIIGDNYLPPQPDAPAREQPRHSGKRGNPTYTWLSMYSKVFDRGTLIRFKLLNGNFLVHDTFWFSYFTKDLAGNDVETLLPATAVGSDSTLFKDFVHGITYFDLGAAERLELLLDLSKIPASVKTFNFSVIARDNLVLPDGGSSIGNFSRGFYLSECSADPCVTTYPKIPDSFPSMPDFVDLTKVKPDRMRFRVLDIYRSEGKQFEDDNFHYYINVHTDFMKGQTENPQIGTTEDWFYTNFLPGQEHPMHVHLVQFQVIEKYQLKEYRAYCSFYSIDFYRRANYTDISDQKRQQIMTNNSAMCDFIENQIRKFQHLDILEESPLNQEHQYTKMQLDPLDISYVPNSVTKVSGVYIFKPITTSNAAQYAQSPGFTSIDNLGCDPKYKNYAYICSSIPVPNYHRGWKEVVLIPPEAIVRFRIRFASPDYPLDDKGDDSLEYYKIDEVALTEYPGFVVHCHVLFHEDSEMMRGFMLEFSERWKRNNPKFRRWTNWSNVIDQNKNLDCLNQ